MGRTAPITWHDITEAVRSRAITALLEARIPQEAAEDAVHQAACNLIERQVIPRDVTGLLVRAARNLHLDELRRQARFRSHIRLAHGLHAEEHALADLARAPDNDDPALALEAAEARERNQAKVRGALDALRSSDRETLSAFYFDGRSPIELDRSAGRLSSVTKSRLNRARKRMAKALMPKGIECAHE